MKLVLLIAVAVLLLSPTFGAVRTNERRSSTSISEQVAAHRDDVLSIISEVTTGESRGQVYERLAQFVDTIGPRVSGSVALEMAEKYMLNALTEDGLDNVHGEAVTIPHWVRGNEYATLLSPRNHPMQILGLGTSVGTGKDGITADAIVVSSFDDLQLRADLNQTQGKIVVFNQQCDWKNEPVKCYGISVVYRTIGASKAAEVGAVASLIRTVAPFSLYTPHTGHQAYQSGVRQIPTASVTIEDAELLQRMQERGETLTVKVYMEAENMPDKTGHNVVAEWTGSTYPEEVVLVSGHLDSWDVGQGAMDDGGGAFISWQALTVLKKLNLRPKRTIRLVQWSCEEFGGIGSAQYFQRHQTNISNFDLVMESDMGVFRPRGIQFTGNTEATKIMTEILSLLSPIQAGNLTVGGGGEDIGPWMQHGVPGASLLNENDSYFFYHHSNADTMTMMDSDAMDLGVAVWAATAYVVADLEDMLPR